MTSIKNGKHVRVSMIGKPLAVTAQKSGNNNLKPSFKRTASDEDFARQLALESESLEKLMRFAFEDDAAAPPGDAADGGDDDVSEPLANVLISGADPEPVPPPPLVAPPPLV